MLNKMAKRALLISLVEKMKNNGSWCGETHVQKCVYFLQHLLGIPMEYKYILYKHGPYSFDLNDELTYMRGAAFLGLQPRLPYGPSLYPGRIGAVLKNRHDDAISHYAREIDFVVEALSNKTVKELEKIATALYVKKEKDCASEKDIAGRMIQLKPHITRDGAEKALEDLKVIDEAAATKDLATQMFS